MGSAPLGGSCERGIFPHPRNALHRLEDQPGQIGSFRGSEETAEAVLQQAEERETSTCCEWVLGAKTLASGDRLGAGLRLVTWKQPKGVAVWSR